MFSVVYNPPVDAFPEALIALDAEKAFEWDFIFPFDWRTVVLGKNVLHGLNCYTVCFTSGHGQNKFHGFWVFLLATPFEPTFICYCNGAFVNRPAVSP